MYKYYATPSCVSEITLKLLMKQINYYVENICTYISVTAKIIALPENEEEEEFVKNLGFIKVIAD